MKGCAKHDTCRGIRQLWKESAYQRKPSSTVMKLAPCCVLHAQLKVSLMLNFLYLLLFHLFPVACIFSGYLELLNQLLVSNWFFSDKTFVTFFCVSRNKINMSVFVYDIGVCQSVESNWLVLFDFCHKHLE